MPSFQLCNPSYQNLDIILEKYTIKCLVNIFFEMLQLYIEGYLQAMLDTLYRQEYLRVRVLDNQVRKN